MIDDKSVVWIVGAGFSRSLGAPLLAHLLTHESLEEIRVAFPDMLCEPSTLRLAKKIVTTYALGTEMPHPRFQPSAKHWKHAEEFLERLGLAAEYPDTNRRYLPSLGDHLLKDIDRANLLAKRILAAECCMFLNDADPTTERWSPYRRWAGGLEAQDAVLTFNYDQVPELLYRNAEVWGGEGHEGFSTGSGPGVIAPRFVVPLPHQVGGEESGDKAQVLKLHGSVTWVKGTSSGSPEKVSYRDDLPALSCSQEELCLATPGPEKKSMCEEGGALAPLWSGAKEAISTAKAIVVVGYSFPPTDAMTRDSIFGWVRENINARDRVRDGRLLIHTVLGPSTADPGARRVEEMFRAMEPTPQSPSDKFHVKAWPMYAEDFLSLVPRNRLVVTPLH